MANNYRGVQTAGGASGFVGVDDDRFGNGAANTEPLSTQLANRLVGNAMYLAQGVHAVGFSPVVSNGGDYTAATGDRPWVGLEWVSLGHWDVPIERGLRGVRFGGVVNVQAVVGTPDAELRINIGEREIIYDLPNTESGGNPNYLTIDDVLTDLDALLDLPIDQNGFDLLQFRVSVRSKPGTLRAGTETVYGQGPHVETVGASTFFDESAAGNPDADSLEVQFLEVTSGGFFDGETYEMLHRVQATTNDAMAVKPDANHPTIAVTVQRRYMSYVQVRGLWVQPLYLARSLHYVPQKAIEAQTEVTGQVAALHTTALRKWYRRPQILAFGPEGILDDTYEEYQGLGYPYRWPFVLGSDAATNMLEHMVWIDAENPVLRVRLHVIALQHRQPAAQRVPDSGLIGSAQWTFELLADQLDDVAAPGPATWAADTTDLVDGTAVRDVELPMYPAGYRSQSPFLRQMAQADTFDATTILAFNYREGSLYDEDLGLVQPVDVVASMTGYTDASGRMSKPVRLRVTAVLKAGTTPRYCSAQNATTDKVRLVVVGWTALAYGTEG